VGRAEGRVLRVSAEGREGAAVPMVRKMCEDLMGRAWLLVHVNGAKSPAKTA